MAKKEHLVQNIVDAANASTGSSVHAANTANATGLDWSAVMHSPNTWIVVSTLLFLGIFLRYVLPPITRALDDRSHKIYEQLEQATLLRAQAQELLASYEREREANAQQAAEMIADAKAEAEALRARAAEDLKASIERRSKQAIEKIARAEEDAIAFVRAQMADIASKAAAEIIRSELEDSKEDPAVTRAIKAIEQQIH